MFMFRAPATLVLAVINAAALESAGRRGRVLAAVDAEAQIQLKGSGGGLRLAGAAALRELRAPRAQKAAGCPGGVARGLVHRLRGSRTNASVDETPLSYMRADHEVHQVGLAVFDLWSSDSSQMLDEDAGAVLQPFLQDVETWRAACGGRPGTGRVLLVLPGGAEASDASLWQQMSAEFAAHVARKVLRMRPQDVQVWQPRDDNPLAGLLSDAKQARCFDRVAVLSGDAWAFAWNQRFKCNPQDGRLVLKFAPRPSSERRGSDSAPLWRRKMKSLLLLLVLAAGSPDELAKSLKDLFDDDLQDSPKPKAEEPQEPPRVKLVDPFADDLPKADPFAELERSEAHVDPFASGQAPKAEPTYPAREIPALGSVAKKVDPFAELEKPEPKQFSSEQNAKNADPFAELEKSEPKQFSSEHQSNSARSSMPRKQIRLLNWRSQSQSNSARSSMPRKQIRLLNWRSRS
ncbi:unnamed protein product [Effrenium voratum]|uniref:Uncharacterized protein n=1 Tax=Effrenium voratum TaxID=2562239 RepID=A0AA36IDD2_9DINO|nr:unnamed protein product [Effrenium voratum]